MNGRWMTTRNRHLAAKIEQLIADKIPAGPWITLLLLIATGCVTQSIAPGKILPDGRLQYPPTKTVTQVDTLHGVQVADPYRWLENADAPDTRVWVKAQNKLTFAYLDTIPERPAIRARLKKLWNYERFGVPVKAGGRYFYTRNDGLQNQSVLYVTDSLDSAGRVLLDPNTLSKDGTVALSRWRVSDDGKRLAYSTSAAGSDWQEWRVRNVDTGRDLGDHLRWVKFSNAAWRGDGSGFYYSRYDAPKSGAKLSGVNLNQKLYFHRLGTSQNADELVYHRPEHPKWGYGATVTEDDRYLVITIWQGTDRRNRVYYRDLQQEDAEVVELLNEFDANYSFLGNVGGVFYFRTDLGAPRGRVIAIDTAKPSETREIIPQAAETLRWVRHLNGQLVAGYLKDAHSQVKVFDMQGRRLREIALPGMGSAGGFGGRADDTETFYSFRSFTEPGAVYRLDLKSGRSTVFRQPKVDFNPADFVTRQVFYHSKDGTRVPMFITHKRGLELDSTNPCLLYGYGGFNISLTPSFSVQNLVWMEMGGVYAMPNLRGGGEYGEAWHKAGTKLEKQNVFDDFIAAAEWLKANLYTSSDRLAIAGGSNGGLLVGACMTQRPELFGATLPAVGVMDMLRFHKFTIGWAWTSDYGSPDNEEEFKTLHAYSPYHNLKDGVAYPATMVTTADHDDRVVPGHSFKFAARLQAAQGGDAPSLIRIETRAGHGAGKPTRKRIEEAADRLAFLVKALGLSPVIPAGD